MIASRAANGMDVVVVWRPTQLTDIDSADEATHHQKPTTMLPSKRARCIYPRGNPSTLEASGDALWLTTMGLRVFATVDGQEGGGCRAANLGCLTTPTAWAWFTVHAPLNLSFKTLLLSLK